MKRSCFAFDLNSCLNIFSFFFFLFSTVILINRSFSSRSFQYRSRIVGGTNLYQILGLFTFGMLFLQAPRLVILRLD